MNLKKILTAIFLLLFTNMPVLSLELDLSVDEEIKKKYNSSKLEYEVLPALPKVNSTQKQSTTNIQQPPQQTVIPVEITKVNPNNAIKIPNWTKFQAVSNQQISDKTKVGTNVSFTTTAPIYKKSITIPAGTKIYGVVVNSHPPQKTGNGGLVVLQLTSINYGGKAYAINGKITKVNAKKIFFNNIKGKRQYLSGVGKQINKGEKFYQKAKSTSSKMSYTPLLAILSPIPTVIGVAGYSVCTILSPLTALTTTGGNLIIPTGSAFEIKLLDEAYVN